MVKMDYTYWGRFKSGVKQIDRETIKIHTMLLSIQLVFSVFYILAKISLKDIPAFLFLMIRLVIATPTLWLMALITARDQIFSLPTKREWLFLFISGLFAVTVNQSLFLVGLTLSTASNAAITQPAIPIFSTLFAVLIGYERKTLMKFIGIGIAVVGAILMIDFTHLTSDLQTSKDIVLGNLCFFGNTIAYAIFLLSQRPLVGAGMNPAKCMAWCFLIGTPLVVLVCLVTVDNIGDQINDISVFSWVTILYTAFFATAYTFWASSVAVKKTDPTTVAVYLTVEPLATSIMAFIFLHERLTPLNIVGGFIILAGVITVMISKHKEKKKDELDRFEKEKLQQIEIEDEQYQLDQYNNRAIDLITQSSSFKAINANNNVDENQLKVNNMIHNNSILSGGDIDNNVNNSNYQQLSDSEDGTMIESINPNEDEDSSLFLKNSNNKLKL